LFLNLGRAMPADFPPWRTVYGHYQRWNASGAAIYWAMITLMTRRLSRPGCGSGTVTQALAGRRGER
jgi:transposase